MSVLIASAAPPAATHAASASWIVPGSAGLLVAACARMTTFAPRPAQRTAMASPIPRDAPVTTTVRPRMLNATSGETAPSTARTSWSSAETRFARYARRLSKKGVAVFREHLRDVELLDRGGAADAGAALVQLEALERGRRHRVGRERGGERRVQSGDEESGESDVTRSPDTRPSLSSVETSEAFFLGGPLPDRSMSPRVCGRAKRETRDPRGFIPRLFASARTSSARRVSRRASSFPARPPRRIARRDVGPGVHEQDDRG